MTNLKCQADARSLKTDSRKTVTASTWQLIQLFTLSVGPDTVCRWSGKVHWNQYNLLQHRNLQSLQSCNCYSLHLFGFYSLVAGMLIDNFILENIRRHKMYGRLQRCNLIQFTTIRSEPGSSVSIVSGYGLDDRAIEVRSPADAKDFSCSLCVQTGSGTHQHPVQWVPVSFSQS
jgi:hypothetical protein